MKHFFRALGLRLYDLIRSSGMRPYSFVGSGEFSVHEHVYSYSLTRAIRLAPVDPATTAPGSKMGTKCITVVTQQHEVRQDRFGRVHLPNAIKHRLFSK